MEPERLRDVREFWRWGITNSGAGWRVHWGTIEFAEGCRTRGGRFCAMEVGAWTEDDLAGIVLRGGMAGGGPLAVVLVVDWDCTRGGNCGNLSFTCSVDDNALDVILEVLWRIAEVAFDIDCAIAFCAAFDGGWVLDIFAIGFWDSSVIWDVAWLWNDCTGTLLDVWTACWGFVSEKEK